MRKAVRILRDEHLTLAGLLRAIEEMLSDARGHGVLPDFVVLRAVLFYIAEFPERRHHRYESEFLFPKLRARSPGTRRLLDRLDEDHRRGEARIRSLEHALTAFELLGPARRQVFEQSARQYVDFHLAHISVEEREILPLAERVLSAEDWDDIEEAMDSHPDPLSGNDSAPDYRKMFSSVTFLPSEAGDRIEARFGDP